MEPAEEGVMLFNAHDMAEVWPWLWKTVDAAQATLRKVRASARRGGTSCQNGIENLSIPFRHGVAVLYQRAGRNQKLRRAVFDPLKQPIPRKWFEEQWKAIAALFYPLEPGDIPPMAGASKLVVDATVAPAKLSPTAEVKAATPIVDAYSALPLELRLLALGLHETTKVPANSLQ
jgi:hypothetical protein